jgi:hypothetical protein
VFLLSPKSCVNPWSESEDRELDLEELTSGLCSSRAAQALCGIYLGQIAWLVCLWVVVLLVSSWPVWSCFARLCVGFFFLAGYVLGVFLFQGLEKSLRLSGMFVVRLLQPPA